MDDQQNVNVNIQANVQADVQTEQQLKANDEMTQGRNAVRVLLESQKMGGDSREMDIVKESMRAVESAMNEQHAQPMTIEQMEELQKVYGKAIKDCRMYLSAKTSIIKAWRGRKTLVKNALARLLEENRLISVAKTLFELDAPKEPINSGAQLMTAARIYQLSNKMHSLPPAQRVFSFLEKKRKEIPQVKQEKLEEKFSDQAVGILNMMQSGKNNVSRLTAPGKRFDAMSKRDHALLQDARGIRDALYGFIEGEVNVVTIRLGGEDVNLIQRDDNSIYIEGNGITVPVGANAQDVLMQMEDDIIAHPEKYDAADYLRAFEHLKTSYNTMTPGDLVRTRTACISLLHKKTGIERTEFDNVPVADLKFLAMAYAEGLDIRTAVRNKISEHGKKAETNINKMQAVEMSMLQKRDFSGVVYDPVVKEDKSGWDKEESQMLDMLSAVIYDTDTREADKQQAFDEKEYARFERLIGKHNSEVRRLQRKEAPEKGGEAVKILKADRKTFKQYKNGIRMKETLKKHADALAFVVSDVYRDKEKDPEGRLMKMFNKLPFFALDSDLTAKIRDAVANAIRTVSDYLAKELEPKNMDEKARKLFRSKVQFGYFFGQLKGKMIETLDQMDPARIMELGSYIDTIDKKITEGASSFSNMMANCAEMMFDAGGKDNEIPDEELDVNSFASLERLWEKTSEQMGGKAKEEYEQKKAYDKKLEEELKASEPWRRIAEFKEIAQKKETELKRKKAALSRTEKDKALKAANEEQYKNKVDNLKKEIEKIEKEKNNAIDEQKKALNRVIEDTVKGNKGQGLFVKNVMKSYFKEVSIIDKRSMIAAAIRYAKPVPNPGQAALKAMSGAEKINMLADILGGMFKGAGPLFQKMMQGIPTTALPTGLAKAIDEMKDSLEPIPKDVVSGQFGSIVRRSGGRITQIVYKDSLGAASVGQAFLCTLYGPEYGEDGKDVVIKLLRPDVKNRMEREKTVMLQAARDTDKGMEATYLGNLNRYREELDLTIEANNVAAGGVYDKTLEGRKENHVVSMKLSAAAEPTEDSLVIELAEGTTVKRYMQQLREEIDAFKKEYYISKPSANGKEEYVRDKDGNIKLRWLKTGEANTMLQKKLDFEKKLRNIEKKQKYLLELSEKWVTEGVFEKGFYHGDLHAGNIMISEDKVTVIDFGNCTQLTGAQQKEITRMMIAASSGDAEDFFIGFCALLERTDKKEIEKKKRQLMKVFKETLAAADESATGQRIAVALLRAQELGFELPSSISNFSACQIRLQNTVDDMNQLVEEFQEARDNLQRIEAQETEIKRNLLANVQKNGRLYSAELQCKGLDVIIGHYYGYTKKKLFDRFRETKGIKRKLLTLQCAGTPKLLFEFIDECVHGGTPEHVEALGMLKKDNAFLAKQIMIDIGGMTQMEWEVLWTHLQDVIEEGKYPQPFPPRVEPYNNLKEALFPVSNYLAEKKDGIGMERRRIDYDALLAERDSDRLMSEYTGLLDGEQPPAKEILEQKEQAIWEGFTENYGSRNIATQISKTGEMLDPFPTAGNMTLNAMYKKNMKILETFTKVCEGCFDDTRYGTKLKAAYDDYRAGFEQYANNQAKRKRIVKGENGAPDREELYPPVNEHELRKKQMKLARLIVKTQVHMLEDYREKYVKDGYEVKKDKDLYIHYKPENFLDVMGNVISRNKWTAAWRLGPTKVISYLFESLME